jgi:hypothetical protein
MSRYCLPNEIFPSSNATLPELMTLDISGKNQALARINMPAWKIKFRPEM